MMLRWATRSGARLAGGFSGSLLPVRGLSSAETASWEDLALRAVEPNPLAEAHCVIPAARHQPFGAEVVLAAVWERGHLVACVPLRTVRRWYTLAYPVAANQVRRSTYVGTPLLDASCAEEAAVALLELIAGKRRDLGARLLGLDSLRLGGPVETVLRRGAQRLGLACSPWESWERGYLLRRSQNAYAAHLSGRFRAHLRKQRRQLEEHLGAPSVVRDRAGDPTVIEQFIALEAAGYKATTIALAAAPGEPQYFTEMCRRFTAQQRLHALTLECGGVTVAILIALRAERGLFLIKGAYDERYRRFGPGTLLHAAFFDFFHDHTDAAWVDTCASPNNATLLKLYPDRTEMSTLLFSLGTLSDGLFVSNLSSIRAGYRRIKRVARVLAAPKEVRG